MNLLTSGNCRSAWRVPGVIVGYGGSRWHRQSVISFGNACISGASGASLAIPATASTDCWAGLARLGTDKIQFIQARHEEMAAFMASAYAKFTGELGVCIATSGPGASHLITGMYDARMDHVPVLAIAGQQARAALGGHYQQEVDLVSMFKDVAGAFVQQASTAPQVRHLIDRAVRVAKAERRVTALVIPERPRGRTLRGSATQARDDPFGCRLHRSADRPL